MYTKLAIIILHYKNYQETISCVDSALKQKSEGYEIIVVDNGSNDGSYEILRDKFKKTPHVTVKRLKKNLGFARGNNAGIRYARTELNAKNCFICNSDVVFGETLFEELLAGCKSGVGILSPTVYHGDSTPQPLSINMKSPHKTILFTLIYTIYKSLPAELRRKILIQAVKLLFVLIKKAVKGIAAFRAYLKKQRSQIASVENKKEETGKIGTSKSENPYRMQGCAFMLTEEYFRYYNGLYPKTFLYGEELNLSLFLKKSGLIAEAIQTSPVIHKGGQSSNISWDEEGERRRLVLSRRSLFRSLPLLFLSSKRIRKY